MYGEDLIGLAEVVKCFSTVYAMNWEGLCEIVTRRYVSLLFALQLLRKNDQVPTTEENAI